VLCRGWRVNDGSPHCEGELFTFGNEPMGAKGTKTQNEYAPRLVEALMGKKVIGVVADGDHTAVWTE